MAERKEVYWGAMGQWARGEGWTCRCPRGQGFRDEFDLGEREGAVKPDLQTC